MLPIETAVAELIEPVVKDAGFELVRVKLLGRGDTTLQVMAERPDRTMSANDCAELSRRLSSVLEDADPIGGSYRLEVSSPGIDRPLVRPKDFRDWTGREARIELDRAIDGRKRFKGALDGVAGDCVRIVADGAAMLIPLARISAAKLVLTDDLIRENLRAAKRAAETTAAKSTGDPT